MFVGTDDGAIEAFDVRSDKPAFVNRLENNSSIEKLASNGLNLISGDAEGTIKIFDIRSNNYLHQHSNE